MPLTFEIDQEARIVHINASGDLSVLDVQDFRVRLQRDPRFSASYARVIDARDAVQSFTKADIRRLSDVIRVDDQGSVSTRRAVVLNEPAILRLMEIFQAYAHGQPAEYRVFSSLVEAERWVRDGV